MATLTLFSIAFLVGWIDTMTGGRYDSLPKVVFILVILAIVALFY